MKRIFLINILIFTLTNIYAQSEYQLVFRSSCSDSIESYEFELYNYDSDKSYLSKNQKVTLPAGGLYLLSAYLKAGDFNKSFSRIIHIDNFKHRTDTVIVPKVLFVTENALHSSYWNYFHCDNLCNGLVKDYHPNGKMAIEGKFLDGKPYWIIKYREDGTIETKTSYKLGFIQNEKVEYFDENGMLEEYEVYRRKKRKTIKTVYDYSGNIINQEIIKHLIEK